MKAGLTPEQAKEVVARFEAGESLTSMYTEYGYSDRRNFGRGVTRAIGYRFRHAARQVQTLFLPDDPAVRAYIAGLFDGEGSLHGRSRDDMIAVSLTMTDEAVIRWLASFGGKFYVYQPQGNRLCTYRWLLARRRDVEHFIVAELPFLKVKRDAALQALDVLRAHEYRPS